MSRSATPSGAAAKQVRGPRGVAARPSSGRRGGAAAGVAGLPPRPVFPPPLKRPLLAFPADGAAATAVVSAASCGIVGDSKGVDDAADGGGRAGSCHATPMRRIEVAEPVLAKPAVAAPAPMPSAQLAEVKETEEMLGGAGGSDTSPWGSSPERPEDSVRRLLHAVGGPAADAGTKAPAVTVVLDNDECIGSWGERSCGAARAHVARCCASACGG
jgi:hypothetical protein